MKTIYPMCTELYFYNARHIFWTVKSVHSDWIYSMVLYLVLSILYKSKYNETLKNYENITIKKFKYIFLKFIKIMFLSNSL